MKTKALSWFLLLLLAGGLIADDEDDDEPKGPIKLVVAAAKAPDPKLRYRLLPAVGDLEPGNAAVLYNRAFVTLNDKVFNDDAAEKKRKGWLRLSQEDLKKAEAELRFPTALRILDRAARKAFVEWDLTTEIAKEGSLEMVVEAIMPAYVASDFLVLRARLALAEGRLEDALKSYQTALALGHRLGRLTTMTHFLVGLSTTRRTAGEIERFIQQPAAPNLYWAIRTLPRPMADLRAMFELDQTGQDRYVVPNRKIEKEVLSEEEALTSFRDFIVTLERMSGGDPKPEEKENAGKLIPALFRAENEKLLREAGRSEGELKRMHPAQLFILAALHHHRRAVDDMTAYASLPYAEAIPRMKGVTEQVRKNGLQNLPAVYAGVFLAGYHRVVTALGNVERHYAMLCTIEALRLHAAEKGGFPDRLADCVVPVPADPMTGQPFVYQKEKEHIVLRSPSTAAFLDAKSERPLHYEVRLKTTAK